MINSTSTFYKEPKEIHDISTLISQTTAVFPGDVAFKQNQSHHLKKGDAYTLSSIQSTVHIGAHADAPSHYHPKGLTIDKQALAIYLGPCQVIAIKKKTKNLRIEIDEIDLESIKSTRLLLQTNSYPNPTQWSDSFWGLSTNLIQKLAKKNVRLLGIDTPSVDPATAKVLNAHEACYQLQINILEGLCLKNITTGQYFLSALPLNIKDAEASPIRAVLYR